MLRGAVDMGLVYEEEAFQGLGELLAVEGVVDEVAPGLGDALESVDGPGGETREDLHDGVIGEASRRAPLGAIHAADSDRPPEMVVDEGPGAGRCRGRRGTETGQGIWWISKP